MRRRQHRLYRAGIEVGLTGQDMGPVAAAPIEGGNFDAAALTASRTIQAVKGNAFDLALAGTEGHIPLRSVDMAGKVRCPR